MDAENAKFLAGIPSYDLKHVIEVAEEIASSQIDLLLAPVWVPGYNDEEIKKIEDKVRKKIDKAVEIIIERIIEG